MRTSSEHAASLSLTVLSIHFCIVELRSFRIVTKLYYDSQYGIGLNCCAKKKENDFLKSDFSVVGWWKRRVVTNE